MFKNITLIVLSILSFIFLMSAEAISAPSLYGTTGLIEMPTAFGLKYKEYNLGLDYWRTYKRGTTEDYTDLWKFKASVGTYEGLELGIIGENNKEGVFINMKYHLLSENTSFPLAMAIGLSNLTSFNKTNLYMVASKRFPSGVDGHLGFLAEYPHNELRTSLLLGTEIFLQNMFSVLADFKGGSGDPIRLNAGVRWLVSPQFNFNFYGVDLTSKDTFGVSLGFSWQAKF